MTSPEGFINRYKEQLVKEKYAAPFQFKGCTEQEIRAVIKVQNIKRLPLVFRDYLAVMGHGGLELTYSGSDWRYEDMLDIKEDAFYKLEKTGRPLPGDAFVFFQHGGYVYRYFLTDNDDENPPIFQILDAEELSHKQISDSLTDYFESLLDQFRAIRKHLENKKKTNR